MPNLQNRIIRFTKGQRVHWDEIGGMDDLVFTEPAPGHDDESDERVVTHTVTIRVKYESQKQ